MSNDGEPRRGFLTTASGLAMSIGLALSYGTFGTMLGRFVYPASSKNRSWLFVCPVNKLQVNQAMDFVTPAGGKIAIARQGAGTEASDFLALSSVCPHLGCQVHWEGAEERFFCPCHNGAFDRQGIAISGPPKDAHQTLVQYPLKVEKGLLFIEAPSTTLVSADESRPDSTGSA